MSESNIQEKIDGKYKIIEKIGSGGQANIFLVIKIGTNEEYAAKVFKENSDFIGKRIFSNGICRSNDRTCRSAGNGQ